MANILITGASGFIGGFLVEHGLLNGHTIYAAIRKSSNTRHLTDSRINIIYLNLADKKSLKQTWNKIKRYQRRCYWRKPNSRSFQCW